jgi:hypothetical protein
MIAAMLRDLARCRLLVAMGALMAVTAAVLTLYQVYLPPNIESRKYEIGVASAAVLIDSQSSQVVDLGDVKSRADLASLTVRAQLLADLVASSPLKERIATYAGVAPETLIATAPSGAPAGQQSQPAVGSGIAADDRRASTLNISVRDAAPIITVIANAPTEELAGRLADGAVVQLRKHLETLAAKDQVPDARRLVVDRLGAAHTSTETRGPSTAIALFVGVLVFVVWCGAMLALLGFVRGWVAAELEDDREIPFAPDALEPHRPDDVVRPIAVIRE